MPSFILIRQTVWPQYTNVTDRTEQRSDSIGRTVLQTVAQKLNYWTSGAGARAQFPLTGNANDFEMIYKAQRIVKINGNS